MGYDNMHRITSKSQHLTQNNVQFNGTLNVGYDLTYTYGTEAGKKFQLTNVKDVNYRTEQTPGDNKIENNHVYLYDKNGNLIYVNNGRMMNDGHNETGTGERKLIWDEENRLLAVDDNGFVSNYWYDADGEHTVKTSGESDQVYVNGVFSGGSTNTAKFSLYVSPYLVANQGGRYTKHIYAGSQRIVSKVGDFASYGSDPRRIEYAGANTDGLSVDYKAKYAAQQQVIKDNYKFFDVPYNGTDNDNYADGEGFCCNDRTQGALLEANKARSRAIAKSFKDPDNYENLQFFYHPDHLGSSSFITNLEGEVVQHIEYVPFGEMFIEERNNVWNTPYLFNAKEFDEETGMFYYGARYYEPRLSLLISTDPAQEEQVAYSSYCYAKNSPAIYIDPTGEKPTPSEAARMAAHVYGDKKDDILIGRWKKTPNNLGLNLATSCGLKSAVYMRTDAKGKVLEYAYVTAGTEAEWADVAADITQPIGLSKQYSNSADNAKSIDARMDGMELTFIGHSLGGGEAALNALVTDRAAITFNPAGVSDITKFKEGSWRTPFKSEKKIDAYIMRTDPLNILQDRLPIPKANGRRHYLTPKDMPSVYNGHSMDNVLKNFGVNPNKYKKD